MRIERYVALGDSYTAAPYVYLTDVANGCLRSNANYPALLAKKLRVAALVDVSCSAATTLDLTESQTTFNARLRPQFDALTRGTQLVTIGLGANDFGLFASLSRGCPLVGPAGRPLTASPDATRCGTVDLPTAISNIHGIERLLTRSLRQVHRGAPKATVVLVGYPRITSPSVSCPKLLPVSHAHSVVIDELTHRLSVAMRSAAKASGSVFIDMYAASRGHDVCAGRAAWVNGVKTDTKRAAPLHPFAEEQRAVADLIARQLTQPRG
ncbi:MAG: SGNH/GDSL hydrolase family protein [Actinomycetota bacterium]|nr:SGNH/GDSL hydrolase family protein [Actinomycetota bacterium]